MSGGGEFVESSEALLAAPASLDVEADGWQVPGPVAAWLLMGGMPGAGKAIRLDVLTAAADAAGSGVAS